MDMDRAFLALKVGLLIGSICLMLYGKSLPVPAKTPGLSAFERPEKNTGRQHSVEGIAQAASVIGKADFQTRCHAPGVIKCVGFDSAADVTPNVNIFPDGAGAFRYSLDKEIRASGQSSLRLLVPATASQNTSGRYDDSLGGSFGPPGSAAANGTTFHVQFRERMDSAFVRLNTDGEGWKQFGVHGGKTTCQAVGIVFQNIFWRGFPQGFTNCGSQGLSVGPPGKEFFEQGDYNCRYGNPNPKDCALYKANQWMTYTFRFTINKWDPPGTPVGSGSNTIQAWIAYEGGAMRQFMDLNKFPLNYQDSPRDSYTSVTLFNYDSRRTMLHTYAEANCWYDELIVSTNPIFGPE
jgi:hypothetical protein